MSANSARSFFEQHVAQRRAAHEARSYGLPFAALGRQALEAAADVAVCCRASARVLDRHDDLEPATREAIADALRRAETHAAAAWRQLHGALGSVGQQQDALRAAAPAAETPGAPHEPAGCCQSRTWPVVSSQGGQQ